ncbi:hypothetical protein BDFB_011060 [Asbolus verrucosus]|uniref:Uncharacterized protein n=1 Tax=Asbolus verrucosus TaxID=1661398 RepID=A0A482W792_ASBVE|nr:hypothetical protein BDFB_011060 [Asbolus verrucosus]
MGFTEEHKKFMLKSYFRNGHGATVCKAQTTFNYLREFYDNRLISSHTDPIYPLRLSDLTPLDYILLENTIFEQPVHTVDDLKERIDQEYASVSLEVLIRVF